MNIEQRKETAKLLLHVCEVIIIAIIANHFIPELANKLTLYDNMYGVILFLALYSLAMRLLKGVK